MTGPAPKTLLLKNARLVDLKAHKVNPGQIIIHNGSIQSILPASNRVNLKATFIDLAGGYVIPGFIDSHTHLMSRGIELQRIDLGPCRSPQECLDKMASSSKDEILFGFNWDESVWKKGRAEDLDRQYLDRISRTKPVIMRRVCGHRAVCNTAALKRIGPQWTIVDRKTGGLYENAALFLNDIFQPTDEMLEKGLELAMDEALGQGVTSIQEITIVRNFRMFQRLRNQLRLRIAVYIYADFLEDLINTGVISGLGDDVLKFQGIKVFMDGSIGAGTAAMRQPYPGTKSRGTLLVSRPALKRIIRKAENHGLQLIIHSLGDRATETVVGAFEVSGFKKNLLRHRIEHLEVVDDRLLDRIRRLDLIASVQPNFTRRWQRPGGFYQQRLGRSYETMNPFRHISRAGIRMIFGSDSMPISPLIGLEGAVNHPFPCGRLEPGEAFYRYTTAPAYATFEEGRKGRIAAGQLADLVVLDRDPLKAPSPSLIKILMVLVGGKITVGREAGRTRPRRQA